jgi:hypothetical protein|tara:strand:+ start:614 stop:787 length:174 start_codon:yes stop_codon:yes gene_type:complete
MAQPIDHKSVLRFYRVDVNHYKGSPTKLTISTSKASGRSGGEGSCQQWFWDERTNRL